MSELDRALETALYSIPAPDFKARLRTALERKIHMTATVPVGMRQLTPYLLAKDMEAMLAFYRAAFGAEVESSQTTPKGGFHCSFRIGDSVLMMGGPVEGQITNLHIHVDDLEGTIERAVAGGAELTYPIQQAPYGERFGSIKDPAGNEWFVGEKATSAIRHPDMGTVTPYLSPQNAAALIDFLGKAVDAEILERYDDPSRGVAHAKLRIGDSVLELGDPGPGRQAVQGMFYLYSSDVDGTYKSALEAGAASIHPPATQPYGDYVGAFTDPAGNQWYVARHQPAE